MLFRYYRQLIEQVDKWTAEMTTRYEAYLACRKGCDTCCRRKFTVSAVEAYNIAVAFRQLDAETQSEVRRPKSPCTFLVAGACSIYSSRPMICRTFGLPSLHREEAGVAAVSWCDLNFTNIGEDFALSADGIIDVDMLNTKISGVNALFMKEARLTQERIAMDEIPNLDPSRA